MFIAAVLIGLAAAALLIVLLRPFFDPAAQARWLDFLPAAALAALLLQVLTSGFQAVLLVLYLIALITFLFSIRRLSGGALARPVRLGRAVLLAAAGTLGLVIALIPAVLMPVGYRAPAPTGRYATGTTAYAWTDPDRLETFTPEDPSDLRKIAVQFWYPAEGAPVRSGAALEGAPVAAAQPAYPLLVFSHGAFGVRSSNLSTYLELASQGYIVASVDHAYHAFFTSFPDGGQAIISQQFLDEVQANQSGQVSEEENYTQTLAWLDVRNADLTFTLDQVEQLNAAGSGSPLSGRVDLEKIGLFGHSLGGAASAAVCRADPRCKAAAVIDATMFGEYDPAARDGSYIAQPFPQPLLIFYNGETYHATPEHLGYQPDLNAFEHAAAPAYGLVVNGAQHLNFTDLPGRAPLLARLLGQLMTVNGGTAGELPQARCTEILNRYLLAFFDQALRGQPSELLAGQSPYPEVEFSANPSAAAQ